MTKYNQPFKQQVIEFYLQYDKNRSLTRRHFQLADKSVIQTAFLILQAVKFAD